MTSSNIPSPLKWFLGPFSDFASSLYVDSSLYWYRGGMRFVSPTWRVKVQSETVMYMGIGGGIASSSIRSTRWVTLDIHSRLRSPPTMARRWPRSAAEGASASAAGPTWYRILRGGSATRGSCSSLSLLAVGRRQGRESAPLTG